MQYRKGQVTIFIIVALVIVGILLVLIFYPQKEAEAVSDILRISPGESIRSCIEPELKPVLEKIAAQGGYTDPQGALTYQGDQIKYLCYTSEYYTTCVVQQPLIKEHVEKELETTINPKAQECLESFKEDLQSKGYSVSMQKSKVSTRIDPKKIVLHFDTPMTISKDDTRTFNGFDVEINSEMYDLLMISTSIIQYESVLGDSEVTDFLAFYPELSIQKVKLSDGSKVYTLKNVVSGEQFRFASRSLSWPAGFPE